MTLAKPLPQTAPMSAPFHPATAARKERDIRLDFFRGVAMFLILVAHIPGNRWALWIPARFGFSDAAEIFVFCSGMASALAFGRVFDRRGLGMGTVRVGYRIWQVYWAHVCLFIVVAAAMAVLDSTGLFERNYVRSLNLGPFFYQPEMNLAGLLTLTYVPNYFDILPMYLVVLALMPAVVALARVSPAAAGAAVIALWLVANMGYLSLPAEPWSEREWFFNPFGWQLLFFTGFAFMRGWLPRPAINRWLVGISLAVLVASVPFSYFRLYNAYPALLEARNALGGLIWKTDLGLFRYLHFLALAYLAWAAAGPGGSRLRVTAFPAGAAVARAHSTVLGAILKVGQQSLAVFVFSMFAAQLFGFVLDQIGRNYFTWSAVNATGFLTLIGVAHLAAWIKSQPWRDRQG